MAARTRRIPEATVARLPVYLRSLAEASAEGLTTISSERLAELAGVNAAKVRKDLSYLGSYGTRGVGYDVEYLLYQMSRELGLTQDWPVVIAGAGNLGSALANYGGFGSRGFPVVALVDTDHDKVGREVNGAPVRHVDDLEDIVAEHGGIIGVIATPAAVAQEVADRMVAAGITSVLNFAPAVIAVPEGGRPAQGRPGRRAPDPVLLPAARPRPARRWPARRWPARRWTGWRRPPAPGPLGAGRPRWARADAGRGPPLPGEPHRAGPPGAGRGGRSGGVPEGGRAAGLRRRRAGGRPGRRRGRPGPPRGPHRAPSLPTWRGRRPPAGLHRHRRTRRSTAPSPPTPRPPACG